MPPEARQRTLLEGEDHAVEDRALVPVPALGRASRAGVVDQHAAHDLGHRAHELPLVGSARRVLPRQAQVHLVDQRRGLERVVRPLAPQEIGGQAPHLVVGRHGGRCRDRGSEGTQGCSSSRNWEGVGLGSLWRIAPSILRGFAGGFQARTGFPGPPGAFVRDRWRPALPRGCAGPPVHPSTERAGSAGNNAVAQRRGCGVVSMPGLRSRPFRPVARRGGYGMLGP